MRDWTIDGDVAAYRVGGAVVRVVRTRGATADTTYTIWLVRLSLAHKPTVAELGSFDKERARALLHGIAVAFGLPLNDPRHVLPEGW